MQVLRFTISWICLSLVRCGHLLRRHWQSSASQDREDVKQTQHRLACLACPDSIRIAAGRQSIELPDSFLTTPKTRNANSNL